MYVNCSVSPFSLQLDFNFHCCLLPVALQTSPLWCGMPLYVCCVSPLNNIRDAYECAFLGLFCAIVQNWCFLCSCLLMVVVLDAFFCLRKHFLLLLLEIWSSFRFPIPCIFWFLWLFSLTACHHFVIPTILNILSLSHFASYFRSCCRVTSLNSFMSRSPFCQFPLSRSLICSVSDSFSFQFIENLLVVSFAGLYLSKNQVLFALCKP